MSSSTQQPVQTLPTLPAQPFRLDVAVEAGNEWISGRNRKLYKRQQAALARRRLYPLTAFYTLYAILVLTIAFSTKHPWISVAFFSAGCATWTLVEYLFHRYVLHGRFPLGKGLIRKFVYHHSPRGIDKGYGITTRFWDGLFDTRFPESVRRSLSKN